MALAALLIPFPTGAQLLSLDRFSLEPRFGAAFPTGDFGNVDPGCAPGATGCDYPTQIGTETGWRWEMVGHYALTEGWSLAASFGQTRLDCSPSFCDVDEDPGSRTLEETTIVRTLDPVGEPVSREVTYPWSPGFYGGAGASLPLRAGGDLFFTPGFRFHYVPADPPDSDPDLRSIDATYIVAELGLRILLGR